MVTFCFEACSVPVWERNNYGVYKDHESYGIQTDISAVYRPQGKRTVTCSVSENTRKGQHCLSVIVNSIRPVVKT